MLNIYQIIEKVMKTRKLKAIVLAGGNSSRMKSDIPKPLIDLWGQPIIGYVLDVLKELGIQEIATVINALPEAQKIKAYVEERGSRTFVQKESLGTAHAVLSAEPFLRDKDADFLILYADAPLVQKSDLYNLINAGDRSCKAWCGAFLAMNVKAGSHSFGILNLTPGREIISITEASERAEKKNSLGDDICNSGFCLLSGKHARNILDKIKNDNLKKEYFLTDYPVVAREFGLSCTVAMASNFKSCLGVNTAEEFAHACDILQEQRRSYFMAHGVRLIAPQTVFFSYDTQIAPGVIVEPNVIFGTKVTIEKSACIRGFSYIEGACVGEKATIGPYARLRPGTSIGNQAKVGNFVEIKKSYLQQGVKVSHLSYIGDTTIEKNANIGAGTITCNYDGINKHKTHIGEDAFIGSNTALVAPVKIGKNSLIGAGSTITKSVPSNALSLTRSSQKFIDGFRKKGSK